MADDTVDETPVALLINKQLIREWRKSVEDLNQYDGTSLVGNWQRFHAALSRKRDIEDVIFVRFMAANPGWQEDE